MWTWHSLDRDFSVKFQWTQKLRGFDLTTIYWYLYSLSLFHSSSGHPWKYQPSPQDSNLCTLKSSVPPITLIGWDSTIKRFSPKDDRGFDNLTCYVKKAAKRKISCFGTFPFPPASSDCNEAPFPHKGKHPSRFYININHLSRTN